MGKKKASGSEVRRFNTMVRMGDDVAEQCRKVAAVRGISVGEYVTDSMAPIVRADLAREAEKMARESKGEKP